MIHEQETNPLVINTAGINYGTVHIGSPNGKIQQEHESSIYNLICLTIALAGMQFTWAVELAYGTPYLISLGMPAPVLPVVWLAGPLSGLLVQPIIGCISDKSTSKFGRRRPFIIIGYLIVLVSMVVIAYTSEIVSTFYSKGSKEYTTTLLFLAAFGFYLLDFSINAIQACLRALIVDVASLEQQEIANAYASRMIGIGNIIGNFAGFVDLPTLFPFLGNSQMKILCVLSNIFFGATLVITCVTTIEKQYESDCDEHFDLSTLSFALRVFKRIFKALLHLPSPIQAVCNVQFFAWIGWFPFLFYITTWVAEILGRTTKVKDPAFLEEASKVGSFALFLYSIVSLAASFLLPYIVVNEVAHHDTPISENEEMPLNNETNIIKRLFSFLNIRVLFALSHFLFGILMVSGYFVNSIQGITFIVATCGISWAIMMWAPFSIIGEFTRILVSKSTNHNHVIHQEPINHLNKLPAATQLSSSTNVLNQEDEGNLELDAGLILGVHNIYIVLPQFLVNFFSTFVFYFYGTAPNHNSDSDPDLLNNSSYENTKLSIYLNSPFSSTSLYIPEYNPYILSEDLNSLKSNITLLNANKNNNFNLNNFTYSQPEPAGFLLRVGGISSMIAGFLSFNIPSPNCIG